MTSARDDILGAVRQALAGVTAAVTVPPAPRLADRPHDDVVARFCERVTDYRAVVETCAPTAVASRVAAVVAGGSTLVPHGLRSRYPEPSSTPI